ncbi:hypothetical protein PCASD_03661 [Puccinia coronata f. sp. avenae]|uniref:Uncharacterized protein n=1 Tax=Puccinia coronata f. sp. avenae TaxID=200324 RepID=A0A2N5V9S7_9BASI|nr:hypothetical protein PCASD_03661 [Puccinia coronata f. sp. avenae]
MQQPSQSTSHRPPEEEEEEEETTPPPPPAAETTATGKIQNEENTRRKRPHSAISVTFSTLRKRSHSAISATLLRPRRSSIDDDIKQRRLSGWAVFGAVLDEDSFEEAMGNDQTSTHTNNPRFTSPTRPVFQEPEAIINNLLQQQQQQQQQSTPSESFHSQLLSKFNTFANLTLQSLPISFRKNFRVILKCSIAYYIASLFSFYQPLSDLLVLPFGLDGPFSGAHVVATIVTYYRPAATVGGMIEANHHAIWGLFWLAVIIGGSTLTSVWIENRIISHAIVLIVFVGFGYGSMAWVKLKSPGFASTCSMIIVISLVIITREGSIHFGYLDFKKSLIYTEIVLIGMLISNLTCLSFWTGSATDSLQKDINNTLDSFATLVGMLTKTFLLDETIYTDQERLKHAIDRHHLSFTSLKGSLDAAVYEFFEPRIQRSQDHYRELVASMNRLAQHLTGLRSGCSLQYEMLGPVHAKANRSSPLDSKSGSPHLAPDHESSDLRSIENVFMGFCDAIGPSLKTLMATGAACLHAIKNPVNPATQHPVDPEIAADGIDKIVHMRTQLFLAIQVFQESHAVAMKNLYHSFISAAEPSARPPSSSLPPPTCFGSAGGAQSHQLNEEIFVICFFLFNMEEFMRELCHLLDIFVDIRTDEELIQYESRLRWIRVRRRLDPRNWFKKGTYEYTETRRKPRARRQRPKLTAVLPINPTSQRPFSSSVAAKKQAPEGEQNSSLILTGLDRTKRAIYDFFQNFSDPDTKTAIKIGVGAAFMTFPAFWDVTRPTFHHYRAQWAVVTYMIVVASTLGQTNFLVITRMVGTLIGSGVAILAQYAFWQDPVVLPLIGFAFSVPCFWLIVSQPPHASTGRFLLLSYNLICLYTFNVRDKDAHILNIAYNRVVCVFFGVLFGWVINNFVWPYKARRELRKCLSEFLLESAFLYSFLVKHYSTKPARTEVEESEQQQHQEEGDDEGPINVAPEAHERSSLLLNSHANAQLKSRVDELSKMEMFLQVKLIRLYGLLSATRHEPRLKGPFPKGRYQKMLSGCQMMLDMLHSLRAVTVRWEWFGEAVQEDFLSGAREEHRELVGNIILFFGLLSSSIELKAPLPPYLPPASESRQRFLWKIYTRLQEGQQPPPDPASPVHPLHQQNLSSKTQDGSPPETSNTFTNVNGIAANRVEVGTPDEHRSDVHDSENNKKKAPHQAVQALHNRLNGMNHNSKNINYSLFFAFIVAIKHILIQLELVGTEAQSLFGIIGGIRNLSEFEEIFAAASC